jgi:SAM-dependent methyltransferase/uncharacterized protein YbaR (Trm112 family)
MKARLLNWLCCPACRGELCLTVFREQTDIEEGSLACAGCGRLFPIIGGIPRLLPDALVHQVIRYHPDFFARYPEAMAEYRRRALPEAVTGAWDAKRRTLQSYSYQWRRFKQMLPHWERVFLESIHPVTRDFFPGKVGLDAGCGFGRSLAYAAAYGAETIGVDLSEAVESARANTRHLDTAHVVQGDIYHLPIREGSLDFAYSIGVLHHLPDPKAGFLEVARRVAPGGSVFIWVYSRGRGRQIACFTMMRAISTKLPYRALGALCWIGAALQWALWIAPFKLLSRFRLTRPLADRLPFTFHARFPFYVLHTDWFDGLSVPLVNYYKEGEIATWFRDAGLTQPGLDPEWGQAGGGRAMGVAPRTAERDVVPA